MLILDRHRALDFLIASSMRIEVPEPFVRLQPESAAIETATSTEPALEILAGLEARSQAEPVDSPEVVAAVTEPSTPASAPERRPSLLTAWWRGVRTPVAWSG